MKLSWREQSDESLFQTDLEFACTKTYSVTKRKTVSKLHIVRLLPNVMFEKADSRLTTKQILDKPE